MYGVMSGVRCSIRKRRVGSVGSVGGRMPRITDWIQKEERGCGGDGKTNRLYTIFLSRHSIKLHIFGFRPRMLGISSRGIFFRSFCSHVYHWKYHWGGKADEWKGRQVVNNYNRGRCGALIVGRGCREPSQRQPAAASGTAMNVVNGYI